MNIHTDMAVEVHEYISSKNANTLNGIKINSRTFGGLKFTEISVESEEGEKYLGKPKGTYITFESEELRSNTTESFKQNRNFIAAEIKKLLNKNKISPTDPVLVVGLGNWDITPDALGPKTISSLFVSRHLFEHLPHIVNDRVRPVSAISPGVLGTTGIETVEIIKGITERTNPGCIIAIDALVARSISRLGKSLQLSDSGINPGSGVGNHRKGLNKETLGVPVISIGVPTVVSCATIAESIVENYENNKDVDIAENLNENMIVTPKDIDELISDLSEVISSALNVCLHPKDVSEFLN